MKDLAYLQSRTIIDPDTGCWIWQKAKYTNGYGVARLNGQQTTAHKAAWQLAFGEVPTGLNVCHKCDQRACCNPQHLFLGSQAQNIADRDAKQRQSRGSARPAAKLVESQVLAIRERYPAETQRALAYAFGVAQSTIKLVVNRKIWRHI